MNDFNNPWSPEQRMAPSPRPGWEERKERILADFRDWLEQLDEADLDAPEDPPEEKQAPDLASFFGELAALRRNAQLQMKTNEALRRDVGEMSAGFGNHAEELLRTFRDTLADVKQRVPRERREARATVALELIALCEGVQRCLERMAEFTPPRMLWRKQLEALRRDLLTPVELVAKKAKDIFERLDIQPVAAAGERFDSLRMRVVEVTAGGGVPPGTVSSVVRQGYVFDGELIQTAEVTVEQPK